jgi:hypothetical protein
MSMSRMLALVVVLALLNCISSFKFAKVSTKMSSLKMSGTGTDVSMQEALETALETIRTQNLRIEELQRYVVTGRETAAPGSLKDLLQISKGMYVYLPKQYRYFYIYMYISIYTYVYMALRMSLYIHVNIHMYAYI